MLLRTVSLNRMVSWVTMAICERSEATRHVAHVVAVDQQPAAGDIEEARQQLHQRGLARSAGADDGHHFSAPHLQVDVVQHLAARLAVWLVAEADCSKRMPSVKRRHAARAGLFAHVVVASRKVKIADEAPNACWKLLLNRRELAHRLVQLEHRDDERQEDAVGEEPCLMCSRPSRISKAIAMAPKMSIIGELMAAGAHRAQVGAEQPPRGLAEAARSPTPPCRRPSRCARR